MEKNKQLLYCILGSFMLALLNSHIFEFSRIGIFPGGYGGNVFGETIMLLSNILSLAGYLLFALFSTILIIKNIRLRD